MTDYYIDLNHQDQKKPKDKLLDVIDRVTEDDELVISVNSDNHRNIETVTRILDENGFDHLPKGNDDGSKISIIAHLK